MWFADQLRRLERDLPGDWRTLALRVELDRPADADRAAGLLTSLTPGRRGGTFRFTVGRGGGLDRLARVLGRLDRDDVRGTLDLVSVDAGPAAGAAPPPAPAPLRHRPLAASWAAALETLPDDWSDLLCEVELTSSDFMERGALLMSPLNPRRDGTRPALRFRAARTFGYGASPGMTRRCLERLDAERITGAFRILRVLSDTDPVQTQGPVWYVGGRVV